MTSRGVLSRKHQVLLPPSNDPNHLNSEHLHSISTPSSAPVYKHTPQFSLCLSSFWIQTLYPVISCIPVNSLQFSCERSSRNSTIISQYYSCEQLISQTLRCVLLAPYSPSYIRLFLLYHPPELRFLHLIAPFTSLCCVKDKKVLDLLIFLSSLCIYPDRNVISLLDYTFMVCGYCYCHCILLHL